MNKALSRDEVKGRNFAVDGLLNAPNTMARIADLLVEKGLPQQKLISGPTEVNENNLSSAYTGALEAELKVLRAQLYSTGLFKNIECVEF